MSQLHIDDFYHDCGHILSMLFDQFPRTRTLYVEDISGDDTPDEFGLHSNRHLACLAAMQWLQSQGYIQYLQAIRQEAIEDATLTQKAFLLLTTPNNIKEEHNPEADNLPPYARQNFNTNIAVLKSALKSRDSARIGRTVHQLMLESANYPNQLASAF